MRSTYFVILLALSALGFYGCGGGTAPPQDGAQSSDAEPRPRSKDSGADAYQSSGDKDGSFESGKESSDATTSLTFGDFHNTSRDDIVVPDDQTPTTVNRSNSYEIDQASKGEEMSGNGPLLSIDSSGNIYVLKSGDIQKYSPDFKLIWKSVDFHQVCQPMTDCVILGRRSIRVNRTGQSVIGGYLSVALTTGQNAGAVVATFDPNGRLVWSDSFGGDEHDAVTWVDYGLDGSVFAFGHSGQLSPTQATSSEVGRAFAVRYSPTGERLWLTRYTPHDLSWDDKGGHLDPAFVDSAGTMYVPITGYASVAGAGKYQVAPGQSNWVQAALQEIVASSGELGERFWRASGVRASGTPPSLSPKLASDGNSFYTVAEVGALSWKAGPAASGDVYLFNETLNGAESWSKRFTRRTGNYFNAVLQMILEDNQIYVTGVCTKSGGKRPTFIARLTHDGELVWFKEFVNWHGQEQLGELRGLATTPKGTLIAAWVAQSEAYFVNESASDLALHFLEINSADGTVVH